MEKLSKKLDEAEKAFGDIAPELINISYGYDDGESESTLHSVVEEQEDDLLNIVWCWEEEGQCTCQDELFVMDGVQFSVMNINSDIPVAAVTMMNWNLVGVYREWKVPE